MSKKDDALKLALEALKQIDEAMPFPVAKLAQKVIREALAEQPAQQEPVAWISQSENLLSWDKFYDDMTPLYTSPPAQPSKPWVGLTDVEWMNIVNKDHAWFGRQPDEVAHEVAKLVEAKLREKNAPQQSKEDA